MSIITETLNRLEMDDPTLVGNPDKVSSFRTAGQSTGFPVKMLAAAMLVVFAGTGLMAWHWNDLLDDSNGLSLAYAGTQTATDGMGERQLSSESFGEDAPLKPQAIVRNSERAVALVQTNISSASGPPEVAPESGTPRAQGYGSALQVQFDEKPLTVANVNPGRVEIPNGGFESVPAVSDEQRQAIRIAVPDNESQTATRGRKLDRQPSIAVVGGQNLLDPQSVVAESKIAASADQPVIPPAPGQAKVVSESGERQIQTGGSPQQTQSVEKSVVVANLKADAVNASPAKSESVPAAYQPALPSAPKPAEAVSETREPSKQANGDSLQARSDKKPLVVAKAAPAMTKDPAAKPTSSPAVSDKKQKTAPVAPSTETVQTDPVNEAVERARLALSRGQYQRALAALETLSPVPERRADFWLMKGSAHLGLGQFDPAEQAFESAQPLAPDNAQIAVQRAILKQERGDHARALQILGDAATRHPDVPEVFLNQGYSQQELGAAREAGHSFRIFLRLTEGRSLYEEQRKAVNEWLAQFNSSAS